MTRNGESKPLKEKMSKNQHETYREYKNKKQRLNDEQLFMLRITIG